ncbi:MAG: hypothetical protein ACJ789_10950 [Thermomicrobiales bacterium]
MRSLRRWLLALMVAAPLMLTGAHAGSAEALPPCNDFDANGAPSGFEFATYHIVALAHAGELGAGGHIPGHHQGFSLCNPAGT